MSFVVRVLNVTSTSPAAFPTNLASPPAGASVTGAVQPVLFAPRVEAWTALSSSESLVAHMASALPELSITMLGSPGASLRTVGPLQLPPGGRMLPWTLCAPVEGISLAHKRTARPFGPMAADGWVPSPTWVGPDQCTPSVVAQISSSQALPFQSSDTRFTAAPLAFDAIVAVPHAAGAT